MTAAAVAGSVLLVGCAPTVPQGDVDELAEPFGQTTLVLVPDHNGSEPVGLSAYVADTAGLRRQGLMGWESLPDDTGMLFVYDRDSDSAFWMKDTLIPLSIAFAAADGTIHSVLDMDPCTDDPCPLYDPGRPYRYALEVEQGVFDDLGVEPGWRLETVDDAG